MMAILSIVKMTKGTIILKWLQGVKFDYGEEKGSRIRLRECLRYSQDNERLGLRIRKREIIAKVTWILRKEFRDGDGRTILSNKWVIIQVSTHEFGKNVRKMIVWTFHYLSCGMNIIFFFFPSLLEHLSFWLCLGSHAKMLQTQR